MPDPESIAMAEANMAQLVLQMLGEGETRKDVARKLHLTTAPEYSKAEGDEAFAQLVAKAFVAAQAKAAIQEPIKGGPQPVARARPAAELPLHPRKNDGADFHYVRSANRLVPPFPDGLQMCVFAAGCFWGTEKGFWRLPGVYSTAVGYVAGHTANPTYRQVCSGRTGHTEATLVVWNPGEISLSDLLRRFLDCHDPTQGDRQGNDVGTQYRSGIYTADEEQAQVARACLKAYEAVLRESGYKQISTEVKVGQHFWFAEGYHQQYLAKPGARPYCSAEPTGKPVPPPEQWGLPEALASKFAPLLPSVFWESYDGTIHTPDTPATLDAHALEEARALRQKQQERVAAEEAALRQDDAVDGLIRFCGGCGFQARAEELQAHLQAAAGVRFGLVQDVGVTGDFDVEVRGADRKLELVHSKKGGDGFVDSASSMEKIVRALQAARAQDDPAFGQRVLPAALAFAPIEHAATEAEAAEPEESMGARVKAEVEFYTSMAPVALFSKSYCGFCRKARELCVAHGVNPVIIDVDKRADGAAVMARLQQLTGQRTVPNVWVRGKFIGGADDLTAAAKKGVLEGIGPKEVRDFAEAAEIGKCAAALFGARADGRPCLCGASPAELTEKIEAEEEKRRRALAAQDAEVRRAEEKYPHCVIGDESIMRPKANGTSETPVVHDIRWAADRSEAERVCNHNRHYAEYAGYFLHTNFVDEAYESHIAQGKRLDFYDSNTRHPLFHVGGPGGRDWDEFLRESRAHGWPSFRDGDVDWERVRVLPNGEVVSIDGTHLGHNLPDKKGNRFCINLVSVAAAPKDERV